MCLKFTSIFPTHALGLVKGLPEAETMLLSLKPNRVNKLKHTELSNRHPSAEWQRQTSFPHTAPRTSPILTTFLCIPNLYTQTPHVPWSDTQHTRPKMKSLNSDPLWKRGPCRPRALDDSWQTVSSHIPGVPIRGCTSWTEDKIYVALLRAAVWGDAGKRS